MTWPIAKPRPWGLGGALAREEALNLVSAVRSASVTAAGQAKISTCSTAAWLPGHQVTQRLAAPALDGAGAADRAAAGSSGAPGGGQAPTGGGTVLPCLRFAGGEAAGGVDRAGRVAIRHADQQAPPAGAAELEVR